MKIKLTNNFHNTEAYIIPRNGLTIRQVARAKKILCPVKECACGQCPAGTRGSRYHVKMGGMNGFHVVDKKEIKS